MGTIGAALAASAAATIGSSALSASAAGSAASEQGQAAQNALNNQNQVWGQVQNYFSPYVNAGNSAISNYSSQLPGLANSTQNIQTPGTYQSFNPSDLAATPGYQFTLNQGLQATQNGFSSQGLNNSGAATKGAAQYASGLASNTYNQQLQNYMQQQGQQYNQGLSNANFSLNQNQTTANMLQNAAGLGQNAVSSLSGAGLGSAQQVNNLLTQQGNAAAAGTIGQANALSGGLNSLAGTASTYGILNGLNPQSNNTSNTNPYGSNVFNMTYPSQYTSFGRNS